MGQTAHLLNQSGRKGTQASQIVSRMFKITAKQKAAESGQFPKPPTSDQHVTDLPLVALNW